MRVLQGYVLGPLSFTIYINCSRQNCSWVLIEFIQDEKRDFLNGNIYMLHFIPNWMLYRGASRRIMDCKFSTHHYAWYNRVGLLLPFEGKLGCLSWPGQSCKSDF